MSLCSENRTKGINAFRVQNFEFLFLNFSCMKKPLYLRRIREKRCGFRCEYFYLITDRNYFIAIHMPVLQFWRVDALVHAMYQLHCQEQGNATLVSCVRLQLYE
jgi:hypothetical protein